MSVRQSPEWAATSELEPEAIAPTPPSIYPAVKRGVDVAVSALLLLLLLPVMAVLALLIKLDTPGPVLFSQDRVGRGGRVFRIYKFRSMVAVAPPYSVKIPNTDPRVTRVGRFLRLSGLDELPQLVNVLRGDMSLIGPRPEMQFIVDAYEPWQRRRHLVTPGITGWWQVHHRNEVPMHLNLEYDLYYIDHMGPWLDLRIAGRTASTMLLGIVRALFRSQETA